MLFGVLLRPVLEEFFFRGVVQQGAVASLGPGRGVLLTAALFALVRASLLVGNTYLATSFGLQALGTGVLLGFVRLATGSILPGVLLLIASGGLRRARPRATRDAPDRRLQRRGRAHTASFLLPAALCVATGVYLLVRHAREPR